VLFLEKNILWLWEQNNVFRFVSYISIVAVEV